MEGHAVVIIDHAVRAGLPIPVFTVDTGLMFPETIRTTRIVKISATSLSTVEWRREKEHSKILFLVPRDQSECVTQIQLPQKT